jgi:hypothetical protein
MTPQEVNEVLNNLSAMVTAAEKLNELRHHDFNEVLTEGYPKYLPSFDEFCNDLSAWLETADNAQKAINER